MQVKAPTAGVGLGNKEKSPASLHTRPHQAAWDPDSVYPFCPGNDTAELSLPCYSEPWEFSLQRFFFLIFDCWLLTGMRVWSNLNSLSSSRDSTGPSGFPLSLVGPRNRSLPRARVGILSSVSNCSKVSSKLVYQAEYVGVSSFNKIYSILYRVKLGWKPGSLCFPLRQQLHSIGIGPCLRQTIFALLRMNNQRRNNKPARHSSDNGERDSVRT